MTQHLVKDLDLLLTELFALTQKKIRDAPEGLYALFLRATPHSILKLGNQRALLQHRTHPGLRSRRHELKVGKLSHIREVLKFRMSIRGGWCN